MQFKHPEILYTLLLLLIPIIVHLFQLRRFQKVPFTNVAFLKEITLQTRKSAVIKKWLILITRLLLLAAIVFAFAQPYTTNKKSFDTKQETVIYLDNSFSMQAKGNNGTLLQQAINELISSLDETQNFSLITNDETFFNTNINTFKNELLQLKPTANQLNYDAALLRANKIFTNDENSLKNLVFISDFQQNNSFNINDFNNQDIQIVQLQPVNTNNITVDSVYVTKTTTTNLELSVILKNQGDAVSDVSVSLFNDDKLLAKSAVDIKDKANAIFTIPNNTFINGKITINDSQLQFDNSLFFNINKPSKINVLSINNADDAFLEKVYSDEEFSYKTAGINNLNYNDIDDQNLIILNELNTIPISLITALQSFKNNGGNLLIIPKDNIDLITYNQLLDRINIINLQSFSKQEKRITKINFSHPLFKDVFSKQVTNFQYPKVNGYYELSSKTNMVLGFEDNQPFLVNYEGTFLFTSALNNKNSNFKNSPLIVPTLYNIGKQSLKLSKLYNVIGEKNEIDVRTKLKQDEILSLIKNGIKIIPQQQSYSNKVTITTTETPGLAGIYDIVNDNEILEKISYNYRRSESNLYYENLKNLSSANVNYTVTDAINNIKSNTKINELWKWFIIFTLLLLAIEMLILKFFK